MRYFWLPCLYFLGLFLASIDTLKAQTNPQIKGLRGEYYTGRNFNQLVVVRTDASINFNWTAQVKSWMGNETKEYREPAPGVGSENFSIRWTGQLLAPESGTYTIQITTDDGMRVWLGNVKILDYFKNQPVATYSVDVNMEAGRTYPLKVEYYQANYDAVARLSWVLPSRPDVTPFPIPAGHFYLAPLERPKPIALQPSNPDPEPVPNPPAPVLASVAKTPIKVEKPKESPKPAINTKVETARSTAIPALRRGTTLTLPNLYFELNTPELLPTSTPTLNALVKALDEQPDLQIEIAGHTDLAIDKDQSLRLSRRRAEGVKEYLTEHGIDSSRITTLGYGCSRPKIAKSDASNRRVEVRVK
jgi:outer membrane protein OmpA-like peptidoglycan-associated protein